MHQSSVIKLTIESRLSSKKSDSDETLWIFQPIKSLFSMKLYQLIWLNLYIKKCTNSILTQNFKYVQNVDNKKYKFLLIMIF